MGTDDYGNAQVTGYADSELQALWVGRRTSRELVDGRTTLVSTAAGMFPAGADVDEDDELTALGVRWRITGVLRVNKPTNPNAEWHVSVDLERAD